VPGEYVKIRAAEADSFDSDEHIGWAELWKCHIPNFNPADVDQHAGAHCFG
jgi:hypothetical protein